MSDNNQTSEVSENLRGLTKRNLILVRHSAVSVDPSIPAHEWHLSAEGRNRAERLAEQLTPFDLSIAISSYETKAHETAAIIAAHLALPHETAEGLHEHVRDTYVADRDAWEAAVSAFFARPDELVLAEKPPTPPKLDLTMPSPTS